VLRIRSKSLYPDRDPEELNGPVIVKVPGKEPVEQKQIDERDQRRYASGPLRARVLLRDNYRCRYCGTGVENDTANVDHVIPWKYGGQTRMRNLVTCCRDCNRRKGNNTWKPTKIQRRRKNR